MAYYNSAQEQPQIQVQYQAPIVYYATPVQSAMVRPYGPYYDRKTSIGLGATQIVLACLSIAAGAVAIVYEAVLYFVGIGIWGGAFFLVAGSLCIAAGKDPTNGLITATLVFSVFDILVGAAQLSTTSVGLQEDLYCNYCSYYYWVPEVAANSLMIAVGSLEFIFGIWMTVVCARAIDKGSKAQLASIPVTFAPNQQPETVFIQGHPPTTQHQPPPYYVQAQHPTASNQQQMIQIGVQHPSPSNQQPMMQIVQHPSASNPQPMMQIEVQQTPITNIKL